MIINTKFPEPASFNIKRDHNGTRMIFDCCRKKYVALTPEEWVRQNFIHFLISEMHYPQGLISVEKGIRFNGLFRRYDIVVYDKELKPWMLVECKEPAVKISETTLRQLMNYNSQLKAPFWLLTNGTTTFCAAVAGMEIRWLSEMPVYNL